MTYTVSRLDAIRVGARGLLCPYCSYVFDTIENRYIIFSRSYLHKST